VLINVVTLRQAQLVLGWVTVLPKTVPALLQLHCANIKDPLKITEGAVTGSKMLIVQLCCPVSLFWSPTESVRSAGSSGITFQTVGPMVCINSQ